ncbi:MAG: hypothetical protein ACRCVT_05925 [Leadbetterella sp.]
MNKILFFSLLLFTISASAQAVKSPCSEPCQAKSSASVSCKLSSKELMERKANIIKNLKNQVIEKRELDNGYAYKFVGTDKMVDELIDFVKSERQCCDFFTFNLSIGGDKKEVWLEMIGSKDAKEFIKAEMDL